MKSGTLTLDAPQLDEWTIQAINGIRIWQRNGGDTIVGCETLDYVKVRTAAQILVYDAGGNDDHVSRLDMRANSRGVSKPNQRMLAIDAQYIMSRAPASYFAAQRRVSPAASPSPRSFAGASPTR